MRASPNASPWSPRHRRSRVALAALAAATIAGGVALLRHAGAPTAPVAAASGAPTAWRASWTAGLEYTFGFAWDGETHARLAAANGPHVDVAYDLAGRLVARASADGPRTVLELRLADITRHALRAVAADSVPGDDDARTLLEAPRAWAEVGGQGQIERLRFAVDAPKVFREALTKLVEQMAVTGPVSPAPAWTASEPGPNGRADVRYEGDGLRATRVRERYTSLSAMPGGCAGCDEQLRDRADLELDARGVVGKLEDTESLRVVERGAETFRSLNHFTLELRSIAAYAGPVAPPALADLRTPGEPATLTAGDQQAVLESSAAGFTQEQLDAALDRFARKGEVPADKTWLVHGRAYLRLHPEAVESLGRRLASPDLNGRGRNMVLQVLAVVGNPRAQEIMRTSLAALRATEPVASYVQLAQKLSFVDHPTRETRDFVEDAYRTARSRGQRDVALASATTLGNIASRLARGDDPVEARHIMTQLEDDLRDAKAPADRAGLLVALRGAGDSAAPAVRALAADDSAEVRGEVARSLGEVPSADARTTLLSMTSDSDIGVSTAAVASLDRDRPTQDDVRALAAAVLAGQTSPALDGQLMDFFAGHMDAPEATAVLAFILARTKDPAVARRVRALLEQHAS